MKICPYCGEEIKDVAKKCRYCGEFLNEGENTKEENKDKKQYGFRGRFFRKDLELNKKRGHRFLKIFFYILLLLIFIIGINGGATYNHYHKVDDISSRIEKKFKEAPTFKELGSVTLNYLIKDGEILGDDWHCDDDYSEIYNKSYITDKMEYYYCSNNWDNETLQNLTTLTALPFYDNTIQKNRKYIEDYLIHNDQRKLREYMDTLNIYSNVNTVKNTVNSEKRVCISRDNIVNTNFYFLDYSSPYVEQNICFLKKDGFSIILDIIYNYLSVVLFDLIVGAILILLYYKIIIYIKYGGYKNK